MAYSYEFYKKDIKEYLKNKYTGNVRILDVGAGCGTYYDLLHDYFRYIDAVEVFKPNIENYNLTQKYHKVFNINIKDFRYDKYDIIIFGDIIEHLDVKEAQEVLKYAYTRCKEMIVAVPYQLEQGIEEDNIYEIHKQADLTPKIMEERYPFLKLLYKNELYGYYIKEEI
jgi:2-polyprenyl-3-methyl-5-hydroxy-6-metoxy-1,4-benzoquinol methylase